MSTESLKDLSKTLGRRNRADILEKLRARSCRNIEISEDLHISKERVSEALTDLVSFHLVIPFEMEAIVYYANGRQSDIYGKQTY